MRAAVRRTEAISPARRLYRPLVVLASNQEFGLFYYAIVAAVFSLIVRRDRPSLVPLLWLALVGGYTLWGTVRLSAWEPLYTWPRYLSMVTLPCAGVAGPLADAVAEFEQETCRGRDSRGNILGLYLFR